MAYLDANLKKDITRKFSTISEVQRVILFGSRARGDACKYSDIDLAVETSEINLRQRVALYQIVEELETLLEIDLILLDETAPEFSEKILKEGEVLYERRKSKTENRKLRLRNAKVKGSFRDSGN